MTLGADMQKRKTIMIDLDGVLNMYDGKFDENKLPEVRLGAKEFVKTFRLCNQRLLRSFRFASVATAAS